MYQRCLHFTELLINAKMALNFADAQVSLLKTQSAVVPGCSSVEDSHAESLSNRTRPATPAERSQGSSSKSGERALANRSASRSPTVRMREESVLLRRAALVPVVQTPDVWNRHDVAVVT